MRTKPLASAPLNSPVTLTGARSEDGHPKRSLPPVKLAVQPVPDAIRSLVRFQPASAPVVSVYLAVPENLKMARSKIHDMAKHIRHEAESLALAHSERQSVHSDADRVLELEAVLPSLVGRTLALFRCADEGLEEAVVVPGLLRDRVFVDAAPYLRPLLAILDKSHRYAVVTVDREHSRLYDFFMGRLEAAERHDDRVLRKPNYAGRYGLDEYRVRNTAEDLARKHYRHTAEVVEEFMHQNDIELLVIGGHQESISAFRSFLSHELQSRIVGTFVIDPHTVTPARVRDEAERVVDDFERRQEAQLVGQAIERADTKDLGALGLEWCLAAVDEQAVQLLLINDHSEAAGRRCDNCGWLGVAGVSCPVCGYATRAVPDVIDEMAAAVVDAGGLVDHVDADTPLRDHLVAALLRFPIPAPGAIAGAQGTAAERT